MFLFFCSQERQKSNALHFFLFFFFHFYRVALGFTQELLVRFEGGKEVQRLPKNTRICNKKYENWKNWKNWKWFFFQTVVDKELETLWPCTFEGYTGDVQAGPRFWCWCMERCELRRIKARIFNYDKMRTRENLPVHLYPTIKPPVCFIHVSIRRPDHKILSKITVEAGI